MNYNLLIFNSYLKLNLYLIISIEDENINILYYFRFEEITNNL